MLSLNFIREHPDAVRQGAYVKGEPVPLDEILKLDRERRDLLGELERLRSEQKQQSAGMAKSRQGGAPAADQAVIERSVVTPAKRFIAVV